MRLLIGLAAMAAAWGQAGLATLGGVARDATGAALDGVMVELRSGPTGVVRRVVTGVEGEFRFLALPPGEYAAVMRRDGFAEWRREGIVLRLGETLEVQARLEVIERNETVEVRAEGEVVRASSGAKGYVVGQERVVRLPLDGRNFVPLIALLPGVSLPPGSLLPRINGSRPRVSEYIYDGISVLQPEPGQVAFYPVIDAIEEFRVETSAYGAEYGRSNGGAILVQQKSGGNELHGTLFGFVRNEALNARNLFATQGAKPRFRRSQHGFVVGGPVERNKTFFFGDWQGTRLDTGIVRTSTVPGEAARAGRFAGTVFDPATTQQGAAGWTRLPFPGGVIPEARWDGAARRVMERYPAANAGTQAANNYVRTGVESTRQDQMDGRVDRYFGEKHRIFSRYTYLRDHSTPTAPLPDGSGLIRTGVAGDSQTRAHGLAAEHTWTMSPRMVNQARLGYTRRSIDRSSMRGGARASEAVGIPGIGEGVYNDVWPVFDVVGMQQVGPTSSGNAELATSVTQLADVWTRAGSRSMVKAGVDVRMQHLDVLQPANPTGRFQFTAVGTAGLSAAGAPEAGTGSSVASLLLGQVQLYSADVQKETLQPRATVAEAFVQSDWRVTERLTVNAGVRYTLNFPSTEARDRAAIFDLATQELRFLGRDGMPRSARDLEKLNFGPRVGLAWRASEVWVMRAGYGLNWIEQAGITTPFTTPLFPFVQTLEERTADNIRPAFVLSNGPRVRAVEPGPAAGVGRGVFGVQRDQGSGYAQQWNFTVERRWGSDWTAEVGYVGSKLTAIGVPDVNLNQLRFGEPGGLRPYPRQTTVALYRNNVGHSTYHSLQARVERRFAGGVTWTGSYTWSKLIDDAGAVFDSALVTGPAASFQAADSHNRRLEKDESTGSIPHAFSSGFVYELPWGAGRGRRLSGWKEWLAGGWQLAGIVRAQTGSPIAVTQAANLNAFAGFGVQRPHRVGEVELERGARTTGRYFHTAAFAAAGAFTLGTSSRNPARGPGYATLDVMAGKRFALGERMGLEFRAEAFNATNTPPLGSPNGSFGTAAFGSITTALDPRVFEMVVKLAF